MNWRIGKVIYRLRKLPVGAGQTRDQVSSSSVGRITARRRLEVSHVSLQATRKGALPSWLRLALAHRGRSIRPVTKAEGDTIAWLVRAEESCCRKQNKISICRLNASDSRSYFPVAKL